MKESNLSKTYLPKWQAENGKDSHLFRNNTGSAYQGEVVEKYSKTNSKGITDNFVLIKNIRFITFGIGILKKIKKLLKPVGGGDYIGWTSRTVCEIVDQKIKENASDEILSLRNPECKDMDCNECIFGEKIAIFTSIEFKTKNVSETKDQKDWKELVRKSGGIAEVVKEPTE